ncbi:ATP-binding cassette domain-containing protein [Vibrio sp. PP-XX7]
MIEFRSVSFTYPNSQVGIHNVSFAVKTGELLAVLGKSGCGKTTMLKLLAGFEQPHQGEIWINGQNQHGLPCAARHLGIVFQDYALFPITRSCRMSFILSTSKRSRMRQPKLRK